MSTVTKTKTGHYTFQAHLTLEAGSEEAAEKELTRRLARLSEAGYVAQFKVNGLEAFA